MILRLYLPTSELSCSVRSDGASKDSDVFCERQTFSGLLAANENRTAGREGKDISQKIRQQLRQ